VLLSTAEEAKLHKRRILKGAAFARQVAEDGFVATRGFNTYNGAGYLTH